jgi:uncharacterized protein (TIGR02594 family)
MRRVLIAAAIMLLLLPVSAEASRRHPQRHHSTPISDSPSYSQGFGGSNLVSTARRYIGTNPTGRGSLWCGAFMDKVLRESGYRGGGNLASGYSHYGTRVSGPQIGAIAIMGRRGGGHVGVVSGIDANGNPIIISGNTWSRASGGRHTTLEHSYPAGRVYAYVIP